MAETKKAASKRIIDVQHADKAPAEDNSKPVIVTNRPLLQDPMMIESTDEEEPAASSSGNTIKPLSAPEIPGAKKEAKQVASKKEAEAEKPEDPQAIEPVLEAAKTKTLAELDAESKTKASAKPQEDPQPEDPEGTPEADQKNDEKVLEDEAEEQAKQDEELSKLIETKQYFLPINTVEKRRSKRVVIGGVFLSLILIMTWIDVALDAGLIQIGGLKSITHFFSS